MTILGYDIDGQPLRAGDRVVVANHPEVQEACIGKEGVVKSPFMGALRVDGIRDLDCGDDWVGLFSDWLRKLPPKQADNETTTWESIEQLTGWVPEGVRA